MAITRTSLVIPPEYVSEIIQNTVEESAALQLCRRVNMGTGVMNMPVMSALPSGGWVNPRDTGIKMQSDATWQDVTLTAEELAVIVTVPEAVLDDANFDIFAEIRPRVSEKFGQLIDLATIFGVNAPASFPTGGITGHAAGAGNSVVAGAVSGQDIAEDINQTMYAVEADGFEVDSFVGTPLLKSRLRGLRNTYGGLLFQPTLQVGTPDTLYGLPIEYSRNAGWDVTNVELVTGDFDMAVIGIRQDMNVKILTEATFTDGAGNVVVSLAETDQVALRCYMRVGFAIANPVTLLQPTAGSRSPFAILRPAGWT